jgi:hypothetical protein
MFAAVPVKVTDAVPLPVLVPPEGVFVVIVPLEAVRFVLNDTELPGGIVDTVIGPGEAESVTA